MASTVSEKSFACVRAALRYSSLFASPLQTVVCVLAPDSLEEDPARALRAERCGSPQLAQERVHENALLESSCAAPEGQRGAGSDGEEVDGGLIVIPVLRCQRRKRKQGQPLGRTHRLDAFGNQLVDVLPGDRCVRADVDDVVTLVAGLAEIVDDLRDDALGDMGLAKSDLVGNKEPNRRVLLIEHAPEHPLSGTALEVLQRAEHDFGIERVSHGRSPVARLRSRGAHSTDR